MSEYTNKFKLHSNTVDLSAYEGIIHGSYKEDKWPLVEQTRDYFIAEGLTIPAPKGKVIGYKDGFAILEGEEGQDTEVTELSYVLKGKAHRGLKKFGYYVTIDGM